MYWSEFIAENCEINMKTSIYILVHVIIHWRIQGALPAPAPLRGQILSFWHTKFSKRNCLKSWHPPTRNPGSATVTLLHCYITFRSNSDSIKTTGENHIAVLADSNYLALSLIFEALFPSLTGSASSNQRIFHY